MSRFILEGEWSGYTSGQTRVVHREVITEKQKRDFEHLHAIRYTDGTCLHVDIRPARPREKVDEKHSYGSLIRDAAKLGKSHVSVAEMVTP